MEIDSIAKKWLEEAKIYINKEEIKEAIDNYNFEYVFKDLRYSSSAPRLTAALVAIFDDAHIDWLSYVKELPPYAYDASNIQSFVIPSHIEVIHRCAFWGCKNLVNLVIPKSVVEIKDNILTRSNRAEVYYEGTKAEFRQINGYTLLFKYSPKIVVYCSDGELKQFTL